MTSMKFFCKLLLFIALLWAYTAKAQTVPDAHEGPFSLYAGGFGSYFMPQYPTTGQLIGVGAFTDIKFRKWFIVEAEGRWLNWETSPTTLTKGASQTNYSVGPKVPIRRFGKFETYGKFLVTDTKITYADGYGYGHFLDYTFGGGADMKLTKHLRLRVIDGEYHYVTKYFGTSIQPYGVSVGLAYRVY